jgi:hypothetical protein
VRDNRNAERLFVGESEAENLGKLEFDCSFKRNLAELLNGNVLVGKLVNSVLKGREERLCDYVSRIDCIW